MEKLERLKDVNLIIAIIVFILFTVLYFSNVNKFAYAFDDSIDTVAIPLGYFFGLKTLFDLELNIPISMEVIGNQRVDISYKNVSSGINTTIVEFFIEIAIDLRLTLPLKVINTCSVTKIPLAYEIINNDVPYFFSSST